MYLTRHHTPDGPRWALDYRFLPRDFHLGLLLQLPHAAVSGFLGAIPRDDTAAAGKLLSPVEPAQEVWAAGVTYLRSREAREAESSVKDVYARVYEATRPELFFKAAGVRVVGHLGAIRVRADSAWNVPEPELTLVANAGGEIVGYCVGNDVSSRDIEGENPLYLPQAKVYEGSCAVGPGIRLVAPGEGDRLRELTIGITISRGGGVVFQGETRTSQLKRPLEELVGYLGRELDFPWGVFLMTGTGIVPPHDFSLQRGDVVRITIGPLTLENEVERRPRSKKA
jgi:2-dehydro-3-deoxy-D-arabinonate dehydratase